MLYPSSEPSQQDNSYEGSQHMVWMKNKKNYHQILPLIYNSVHKSYKTCLDFKTVLEERTAILQPNIYSIRAPDKRGYRG